MNQELVKESRSIIALPTDFVVIDTETTGLDYDIDDIIEISAIRYRNGAYVESYSTLVKPPLEEIFFPFRGESGELVTRYVPDFISDLTGITNEMLENAPTIENVLPGFLDFIGTDVLVGHNVSFDVKFLQKAAEDSQLGKISNDYINTIRIARKAFPEQEHYRLSDVSKMCNIIQTEAHRALVDCEITAKCFLHMREKILSEMSEDEFVKLFSKKRPASYVEFIKGLNVDSICADESSPIFGKTVVFTGTLERMVRKDALTLVAKIGGIPADSITKDTSYLVVGNGDFVKSVKNGKTSKMKKAESMALKGSEIRVVSEDTFFKLLSE